MLQSQVLTRLKPAFDAWRTSSAGGLRFVENGAENGAGNARPSGSDSGVTRHSARMIDNLRSIVLAPPANCERFHVVFLDRHRGFLGVSGFGAGQQGGLSLRLRELFSHGLALDARNMLVAHNHPSGDCRPSAFDIEATRRLSNVAQALEIGLVDHLIFADRGVYSMRAGGEL